MTREEAIQALKKEKRTALHENKVAFDMAIKALEQEPCEDTMSRTCSNCAYYDNGANDEACDDCFADEYEHPNFKPKSEPILDKIRAEIKGMYRVILKGTSPYDWAVRWNDCLDEVLEIIDKYKGESEDKENGKGKQNT